MVHDITSRAAARDLLAESGVAPSDGLTEALSELRAVGQQPAPPISPALAEAMSRAADPATDCQPTAPTNVVAIGRGRLRRRGAAAGGAVVLAMAAGMGGVAALGPGNAVENMIDSVIRWAAPMERTEPVSDEQAETVNPGSVPVPSPEVPPAAPLPEPSGQQGYREPDKANGTVSSETAEPALPSPAAPRGGPAAEESGRGALPPIEVPELPLTIPDPVTTPRSVIPVDPPQLPFPTGSATQSPAPTASPTPTDAPVRNGQGSR